MTDMYVRQEPDGFWTIRQERFRHRKHSHDVCAIARSFEELRAMCEKHWPEAFTERALETLRIES